MCNFFNCKKIASYNVEGEINALYCREHKSTNMINVKSKICIYPNCKIQSSFNIIGN